MSAQQPSAAHKVAVFLETHCSCTERFEKMQDACQVLKVQWHILNIDFVGIIADKILACIKTSVIIDDRTRVLFPIARGYPWTKRRQTPFAMV